MSGQERIPRGQLILENRRLHDEVQRLLKSVEQVKDWELYRRAAHVLTSEFIKDNLPLPKFYQEGTELMQKFWEGPLP